MSENSHPQGAPVGVEAHAAGEIIDRHRHDYHQLIYVSTGVLAIHTEQGDWIASRDRAAWVPAGAWHEHRVYGPTASAFIDTFTRAMGQTPGSYRTPPAGARPARAGERA
jgi:quercetin dioxygenase-like cupin family protein